MVASHSSPIGGKAVAEGFFRRLDTETLSQPSKNLLRLHEIARPAND